MVEDEADARLASSYSGGGHEHSDERRFSDDHPEAIQLPVGFVCVAIIVLFVSSWNSGVADMPKSIVMRNKVILDVFVVYWSSFYITK